MKDFLVFEIFVSVWWGLGIMTPNNTEISPLFRRLTKHISILLLLLKRATHIYPFFKASRLLVSSRRRAADLLVNTPLELSNIYLGQTDLTWLWVMLLTTAPSRGMCQCVTGEIISLPVYQEIRWVSLVTGVYVMDVWCGETVNTSPERAWNIRRSVLQLVAMGRYWEEPITPVILQSHWSSQEKYQAFYH